MKSLTRILFIGFLLFGLTMSLHPARAKTGAENRREKPVGVALSLIEPFPCLLGIQLSVNPIELMRVSVGYGIAGSSEASLSTFAAGAKVFLPFWKVVPFISLNIARVSHSGTRPLLDISTSTQHFYSGIGVDVQYESGFNMGLAYNISWTGGLASMPSLYLGWFFDVSEIF